MNIADSLIQPKETTLADIDELTKGYARDRQVLSDRVARLNALTEQLRRRLMPGIKSAVSAATESREQLKAALEDVPHLFQRPRTIVCHGIRVGYEKGKGKIVFTDESKVVELIKKHLPDSQDSLIKVTEKPIKKALQSLPVSDLKRIGASVTGAGDRTVIKPTDTEVDKIVSALLDAEAVHDGS